MNHQRREEGNGKSSSSGGTQETNRLLECAEKAALALHCAHEAGLVHRDVKPGNIMIDVHGEPVVLDFGLVQDAGIDAQDLTASGDLLGTPPYMSPEQVEGKIVDRRSDIYSLAVTLYECLTLRTPFQGSNRQVIYNNFLADPPPDPRKQSRGISKDLWIILSKALEKDPRLRFSSALEFAEELRRIQNHQPIQAVRPGLPVRALRWTQRNRAATAVMLTVTMALLLSIWFLRRSQSAESRLRALSLLGEAMALKDRGTTLAFKLAREAWKVDPSHPDARTGDISEADLEFHPRRTVFAAAFTQGGDRITVGNWGGRIGVWDRIGTHVDDFLAHSNGISSLVYSTDESRLLSASFDGVVKLWDMQRHAKQRMIRGVPWPYHAVSPDGTRLAVMDERGRLTLGDEEGRTTHQGRVGLVSPYKGVTIVSFSPEGGRILIHALGRPLQIFDLGSGKMIREGPDSSYADIARFVDEDTVLYARSGAHQDLMIWYPKTGRTEDLYILPEDEVYDRPRLSCGDASPDGQTIVIGDMTGRVYVDRSGQKIWQNPSQVGLVRDVSISKDSRYILAGTEDGNAYLWDRQSPRIQVYGPQSSGVIKAIFSPDETQIVLGYKSGRIRIWDSNSGRRILELAGHGGMQIHSLAYTRSGWLVSAGSDTTVRWWWTDVDRLGRAIEAIPIQELTDAERRQFPGLYAK